MFRFGGLDVLEVFMGTLWRRIKGLVGLKGDADDEAMADFARDSRGPGASCLQLLRLLRNV